MKFTQGVLIAAQLIDSRYRRGLFPSQNELAEIIERETTVGVLLEAIRAEAARRAFAAGKAPTQWRQFLWPEARSAMFGVKGKG